MDDLLVVHNYLYIGYLWLAKQAEPKKPKTSNIAYIRFLSRKETIATAEQREPLWLSSVDMLVVDMVHSGLFNELVSKNEDSAGLTVASTHRRRDSVEP